MSEVGLNDRQGHAGSDEVADGVVERDDRSCQRRGPDERDPLSDDLDLRDSLRAQSSQVVLSYTVDPYRPGDSDEDRPAATAGLVGPLRSFTLDAGW